MGLLFTVIFVVMLLLWLDWIWWKLLFGHHVDNFFLLLTVLAGGMARTMFIWAETFWGVALGVGFAIMAFIALIVGTGRVIQRRT